MNNVGCQYAIVRFMPFVETGEFANVGVVLMAPKARYFGFKLMDRKHRRVTGFFDQLEAKYFRASMYDLKEELSRINQVLKPHGFDRRLKFNDLDFARSVFAEIVRPRETVVRFSEPRAILAADPKKALQELFSFYVDRDFVTKQYKETVLEKRIRRLLIERNLVNNFARAKVGDEEYQVPFPFVEFAEDRPIRIIKPISLEQEESSRIIEHGGKWEFRIRELRKRNALPDKVLITVQGPTEPSLKRKKAYEEARAMLADTGVTVIQHQDTDRIVSFLG